MKHKITIAIPAYNNAKTIRETIESALSQTYPMKEILIIDDGSTDDTVAIVKSIQALESVKDNQIRLVINSHNIGIGKNLEKLMCMAEGQFVTYLCADDLYTSPYVITDIVQQFEKGDPEIGVIGHFFYFFMDGYPGAIGVCRDKNILTSSCCPSGMSFRKDTSVHVMNRPFIEMPSLVKHYLDKGYKYTIFEYDTTACRFHPTVTQSDGNTGTRTSYYTESPLANWIEMTGDKHFAFHEGFVQLKNRAPHLLWPEIRLAIKMNWRVLLQMRFWVFAGLAVVAPGWFLRRFTVWYRHNITRKHVKIIPRPNDWKLKNDYKEKYTKKGIW